MLGEAVAGSDRCVLCVLVGGAPRRPTGDGCQPQALVVIPLCIYLPVSETLKCNMGSTLPGFLVVPYEKYDLISCFFEHVLHFSFSERMLEMVICIISEK